MAATKFFPPLTAIMPVDALPNELGFVKSGLTNILSHIYFRDLQSSHNDRGDAAFYSLIIVSRKRLDIEIPGTGIFLILNPSHDPLLSDITEFPVSLSYRWPILGYVRQFNLATFSSSPADIFDLVLRVAGITQRQVVEKALSVFVPTASPIDTFVDDVNGFFGASINHPATTSTDPLGDVLAEIDNSAGISGAGGAVFLIYLLDTASEESTRDRIQNFFEDLFDGANIEDSLKQLITPNIEATLEVGVALEFPRNVLEPLNAVGGEPLADQTIKTRLDFDAGSFFYSSERGIGFDQMLVASLNHPSRIASTGFGISLHRAKLDISRTTNIPEADADGRPVDFVGVFIDEATISFPAFWKHDANSSGVIRGKNLLLGTGGISGTVSLEAQDGVNPAPLILCKFGKDFSVSLDAFSITLKQNAIKESKIQGTLVIPGFNDANDNPAEIRIKVDIHQDGDFDITAHEDDGFKTIKCGQIFDVTLKTVFCGKKDDDFYLGISGTIKFTHQMLSQLEPLEVEKLVIWSDGRFEIEGGTIPLPKNIVLPIGPAKLSISAIHMGSHQQIDPTTGKVRDFRYFGFDGGVDISPGGVDVRGKGIKFYYPVDLVLKDCYLEIKSIAIDLVIPGSASKETATLLINGYLSIGGTQADPSWEGGVSFALPKAKIAGGASMQLRPKVPAFIVDAFVELSTPIPLGATGLGIYGFRGLFGQRYVATKAQAGVKETDTWFDYYKAKTPPQGKQGVNISKFEGPSLTKPYDGAFSIGAGVSLATAQDSGKTFSCKLFLLLSLPDLIYLEGKANILGERVGLDGEDPPFFAMLAISSQSVEMGAGVSYKLPKDPDKKGWILDLNAEMRAAFFFKNSSAWYINFGTIQNPTTARVLTLFDASSYVMLSAAGISAGASVTFGFTKSYAGGMVRASVGVYIKVGGFISFERPQIGGFAKLGGHVDVSLMWFSFYLGIDTSLSVEVPRPFIIKGSVHLCVGVTIGFWKFKKHIEKCFDVEFKWEKEPAVLRDPVLPIANFKNPNVLPPFMGTNMLSTESFDIASFGASPPSGMATEFDDALLPLDTWVDLEFLKGLLPSSNVDVRIGRLSGQAPANTIDYIPPAEVAHKVKHQYSLKAIEIKAWNGSAWVDYRPYQAMSPPEALTALKANPSAYKDGFWQNSGAGFNKLRLLAETSFCYMQQGQPGWYVPEQFGITSATLFCRAKLKEMHCLRWSEIAPGTAYPADTWQQVDTVLYRVVGGPGKVILWNSPFGIPRSLIFPNEATAQIVFNEPCVEVNLKLTTFSSGGVIRFFKRETVDAKFVYTLVESRSLTQLQLLAAIQYRNPSIPVAKVEIEPIKADAAAVYALQVQLDGLQRQLYEDKLEGKAKDDLLARIQTHEQQLARINGQGCAPGGFSKDALVEQIAILRGPAEECRKQLAVLLAAQQQACKEAADFRGRFERCFPDAPSVLSYDIEECVHAGAAQCRFTIYDDRADVVLMNSVALYSDIASAERAMFATLELARYRGDYALMAPKRGQYFFQVVDPSGRFIAISPIIFTTYQELRAFVEQTRLMVATAHARGQLAIVRRVAGKLPCRACPGHLECWSELPFVREVPDDGRIIRPRTARDLFCEQYNTLYCELHTHYQQVLDQLTRDCDELTHQLEIKSTACQTLSDQLAALQQLLSTIDNSGGLFPPKDFPCATLLHEACCLSLEDYEFNLSVPEVAAIGQHYADAVQGIETMLTPIWRPDTKYSIHLQVNDTVDNSASYDNDFYFGFRTAGPLGHFHHDLFASYVDLDHEKTADQYMLTGLRGYIDYQRSYPNADGELIRAKPLFYEDARILLFFTKRYVYHFFGDWPAYNGLPALTGNAMQIIIKDPAENTSIPNPPPPHVVTTEIPQAVVSWATDEHPRIPEDIRTLLNLRNPELLNLEFPGDDCWVSGGHMIKPASVFTEVTPQYLKPLKLYTAVVNNVYQGKIREVHQYGFQTSRYPDFLAQVKSYRLDDGKGNQRDAVFQIGLALSLADIDLMHDIVTGYMSAPNAMLAGAWADPFDRLVEGVLKLAPLDAAIGTEFNIVRNTASEAVVAVWIRNPEPLNDPKLPDDVLKRSLCVLDNSGGIDFDYQVLFSKDRAQAFVMHSSKVITAPQVKFRFAYIEWDGNAYVDHAQVISDFIQMTV